MTQRAREKVLIELDPAAWHGCATERVWAEKVGRDRYRVLNIPIFADGSSFLDVVVARPNADGALVLSAVSLRGGHSTYRVFPKVPLERDEFRNSWAALERLGCRYEEGLRGKLLAVDVPSAADIYEVYGLLQKGEDAGVWEFEEGHCGHSLRGSGATGETS